MSRFTLEIEMGNEAMFENEDVADALVRVAGRLRVGVDGESIRDINGNKVGRFDFVD